MKKIVFILLLTVASLCVKAQDNLGIAGSSRSPANTVLINPSTIVDSRAFIDINLVGLSVFVRNNFAYLDGKSFTISGIQQIEEPLFNKSNAPYHAYADVQVHGPSATFAIKQHAFGLYTGARVVADARGITESLGNFMTEGFEYRPQMGVQQSINNLRTNAMGWAEVGLSYGTILARSGNAILQGGATVKRLLGAAGAGIRLDEWTYTVLDSNNMRIHALQGEYGFNDPSDNPLTPHGKGWGFDLGLMYKMRKSSSQSYQPHSPCTDGDYLYRIGISVLDIGKINFKLPYYRNIFNLNSASDWNDFQGATVEDLNDIDSLFQANFQLAQQNSQAGKFKMKLPTAISIQGDYNLGHNFYIFGMLTYGLPRLNSLGVQRASYLGVAPRWEVKRFELSIPVSMYEWKNPQFGLAMRLNSIIIGTDNLLGMLFNQDIYGADVYFNFKYTIFKHWKCSNKKDKIKASPKRSKNEALPCPSW